MQNRRHFTLLEMMVVLMILSLIGTLTTIHIKKLVDSHRFESEVSHLFIALQEAQVLSATYQTDLSLDFFHVQGVLYYQISTEEPLTLKQLNQKNHPLSHVSLWSFNGTKITNKHFDVFSGGRIEPSGILSFHQSKEENTQKLWIDLQHGHLLKLLYNKPSMLKQKIPVKPQEA